MGIYFNADDFKPIVCIDEAAINVTDKKYKNKPVIVIRSSYEHEQGDSSTSRSRHRPGIKLKNGTKYGNNGLEVFTSDEKGNPGACLPKNSKGYASARDKAIVTDFIKLYYNEINRIYNANPETQEYKDAIDDLINKNNGKYIMKRKDDNE